MFSPLELFVMFAATVTLTVVAIAGRSTEVDK